MAKYRRLNDQELAGLEKEFVSFLVVNGIPADDWVKIKDSNSDKAHGIVESFSDVVFEKILRGVKFLEIYSAKSVRSFECLEDEIIMITMEVENDTANFKDPSYIATAMKNPPDDLLIYKTEKPYNHVRELEIFKMIEKGCLISQGKLHKALEIASESI